MSNIVKAGQVKTQIPPLSWVCNGGINPLIRSGKQLQEVAGEQFKEAVRWVLIAQKQDTTDLETVFADEEARNSLLDSYFTDRAIPSWKKRPDLTLKPGIKTTAQFIAVHGGTDSMATCSDLDDLIRCLELVGDYNGFNAAKTCAALRRLSYKQYFSESNPNNGRDLFGYKFAWEGSHAIYVTFHDYKKNTRVLVGNDAFRPYTAGDFILDMYTLQAASEPDEFHMTPKDQTSDFHKARLWWD